MVQKSAIRFALDCKCCPRLGFDSIHELYKIHSELKRRLCKNSFEDGNLHGRRSTRAQLVKKPMVHR